MTLRAIVTGSLSKVPVEKTQVAGRYTTLKRVTAHRRRWVLPDLRWARSVQRQWA